MRDTRGRCRSQPPFSLLPQQHTTSLLHALSVCMLLTCPGASQHVHPSRSSYSGTLGAGIAAATPYSTRRLWVGYESYAVRFWSRPNPSTYIATPNQPTSFTCYHIGRKGAEIRVCPILFVPSVLFKVGPTIVRLQAGCGEWPLPQLHPMHLHPSMAQCLRSGMSSSLTSWRSNGSAFPKPSTPWTKRNEKLEQWETDEETFLCDDRSMQPIMPWLSKRSVRRTCPHVPGASLDIACCRGTEAVLALDEHDIQEKKPNVTRLVVGKRKEENGKHGKQAGSRAAL
jgi:hypothetical protein